MWLVLHKAALAPHMIETYESWGDAFIAKDPDRLHHTNIYGTGVDREQGPTVCGFTGQ